MTPSFSFHKNSYIFLWIRYFSKFELEDLKLKHLETLMNMQQLEENFEAQFK